MSVVHAKGFSRGRTPWVFSQWMWAGASWAGAREAHKICGVDIPAEFLCPITHEVLAMT